MSIKDDVQNSIRTSAALVVAAIGGCAIWTVGYTAGFEKALQQHQKPTVVFGTQIINNSNNYWSPSAGSVDNQELEKSDK
jgi:hypothetical protein